jgi:hypothetical protein
MLQDERVPILAVRYRREIHNQTTPPSAPVQPKHVKSSTIIPRSMRMGEVAFLKGLLIIQDPVSSALYLSV